MSDLFYGRGLQAPLNPLGILHEHIGRPCPYCKNEMIGSRPPTRDHVIPKRGGGTLASWNRMIVCLPCNGDKSDYTLREWHSRLTLVADPRASIIAALMKAREGQPMTDDGAFRVGDRVESPIGFVGRVSAISNGTVHVEYREKGRSNEGVYTSNWFRRWPNMLKNLERR